MRSDFKLWTFLISLGFFLCAVGTTAQERLTPPKKPSKVKSIDDFSNHCFEVYNTVFVYDSLSRAGVEIPAEIEDEIALNLEARMDSLSAVVPEMLEDVDNAPIMRKLRAAGSLNKSRKAITYMLEFSKRYALGESEDENISDVKIERN